MLHKFAQVGLARRANENEQEEKRDEKEITPDDNTTIIASVAPAINSRRIRLFESCTEIKIVSPHITARRSKNRRHMVGRSDSLRELRIIYRTADHRPPISDSDLSAPEFSDDACNKRIFPQSGRTANTTRNSILHGSNYLFSRKDGIHGRAGRGSSRLTLQLRRYTNGNELSCACEYHIESLP